MSFDPESGLGLIDQDRSVAAIWRLAWPVMVMQAMYTMLSVVDMFWVGKLGHIEVAAVALSGSVLGVLFSLGQVFTLSTLAMAARSAGGGDQEGVRTVSRHTCLLALGASLMLAIPGATLARQTLTALGAAEEVIGVGAPYLRLTFAYLPLFFTGMVAYSVFQALGDTKTPMIVTLATNALNVLLDPILIFGWLGAPRLGLIGAAIATATAQSVGTLAMFVILGRRRRIGLRGPLSGSTMRTVFAVGVPAGLHGVSRPLTGMLMFTLVTGFGTAATAAFGVGLRILGIMFVYLGGLMSAGEALVGQSLGRARPDFAVRTSRLVTLGGLGLQLLLMPLVFALAPLVVQVFNAEPEVVRAGTGYLRVLAPFLILLGPAAGWGSAQRGSGDSRPPMLAALVSNWAIKLPLAWFLSSHTPLGLTGVWVGIGISIAVEAAMVGVWYARGSWLRKELAWH